MVGFQNVVLEPRGDFVCVERLRERVAF